MPDPLFTQDDRVAPPLPAELQGRTPQQIAAYYADRERTIRAEAQAAIANAGANGPTPGSRDGGTPPELYRAPGPPRVEVTKESFENDPMAASRELINREAVSRQEWNMMTGAVQGTLIETAKERAKAGKQYWTRLEGVIGMLTKDADPLSKLDSGFWVMAYNAALGQELGRLQQEDAAAAASARASAEAPSGGSLPPPAPRELSHDEMRVVTGLGLTPDIYRAAEDRMKNNRFPVTLDNRRRS